MAADKSDSAAAAVVSRLMQMRQLWDAAAKAYFEPAQFLLHLQNCIMTSRTVTFIIQSNKDAVEGFDTWYADFQDKWRADPIMEWAKNARNTIEKRGDLEAHSQVRAAIIASYMDGPETGWVPQALFASPLQIYRSVPKRFFIPHVVENGTLLIERRWVDAELPDMEILAALAHVYSEIAEAVASFLNRVGAPVSEMIVDTKPDAMGELAMDRALYLSMRDGSTTGYRYYEKALEIAEPKWRRKVIARFGNANLNKLKNASSFREIAAAFFELGRATMLHDGYHRGMTFLLRGASLLRLVQSDFPDRAAKYVITRDLARLAHIEGADGVLMIGEAWTAHHKDVPKSGFAADAKKRGEALLMGAVNSAGEMLSFQAAVERKKFKPKKVKRLGTTEVQDGVLQFSFCPFLKEWGCLDEAKLADSLREVDEAGIETPCVEPAASEE